MSSDVSTLRRPALGVAHRSGSSSADLPLAGALLVVGIGLAVTAAIAFERHLVVGFDDAASHLLVARRVFDNADASLAQLGTTWPPLMHILQLPLVWIDPLFRTGASGVLVSIGASLAGAYYLYRLAELVTGDRVAGFVAAALTAACPSLLYMDVVPMLPATLTACVLANVYYLSRWAAGEGGKSLLAAGLAVSAATLAGYEAWILVPIELALVAHLAHRRWGDRTRTEATLVVFGLAGLYGLVLFVVINVLVAGDPLAFSKSFPGATAGSGGLREVASHPRAVWEAAGPVLLALGTVGAALYAGSCRRRPSRLPALLLLYPFVFFALQGVAFGSPIESAPRLGAWENLHYAATALPGLVFFVGVGFRGRLRVLAVGLVVASAVVMVSAGRVATWQGAEHDARLAAWVDPAARWLSENARGERILVPGHPPDLDRFEFSTRLPNRAFIDSNDRQGRSIDSGRSVVPADARWFVWLRPARAASIAPLVEHAKTQLCLPAAPDGGRVSVVRIYSVRGPCRRPGRAAG